jgi:ribosome biogenesis GTPase A
LLIDSWEVLVVLVEPHLCMLLDLVPRENVEKWLKYLRNEFPVIAFKASTQSQSDRLVCLMHMTNTEDKPFFNNDLHVLYS